jgi:hypothetical protein
MHCSAAWVRDLVLEGPSRMSSLATSLSSVTKLIENRINTAATNWFCWGTRSTLATALLHFPEIETELELLGSGRNADLMEDQVDALWTQACQASESLALFIPQLVAHGSRDGMGEE